MRLYWASILNAPSITSGASVNRVVSNRGQKFGKLVGRDHLLEEFCGCSKFAGGKTLLSKLLLDALQNHRNGSQHHGHVERDAIGHAAAMVRPLPKLRARNLSRGCIFHQIVDGHAPQSIEPGREITQA